MTTALTKTTWIATLDRLANHPLADDNTSVLCHLLHDIIQHPEDLDELLDAYGHTLLSGKP